MGLPPDTGSPLVAEWWQGSVLYLWISEFCFWISEACFSVSSSASRNESPVPMSSSTCSYTSLVSGFRFTNEPILKTTETECVDWPNVGLCTRGFLWRPPARSGAKVQAKEREYEQGGGISLPLPRLQLPPPLSLLSPQPQLLQDAIPIALH